MEELDPDLTISQVCVLVERLDDLSFESYSGISTAEEGLVAEEEVAFLVPIVLRMIHVSVTMRAY